MTAGDETRGRTKTKAPKEPPEGETRKEKFAIEPLKD